MIGSGHFHPMFVHFPIALITIGFIFDIIGLFVKNEYHFFKFAYYLMILGTISSITAYLTGEFFTPELDGIIGEVKENHEIFAKITIFTIAIATLLRTYINYKKIENSNMKYLVIVFYAIALISVCITGYSGGTLVYDYGIH